MLAMRAKQGDTEATGELWERVRLLIYKIQGKYAPLCDKCGIEREDLRQSGFFALLAAVKAFNPDKGYPFNSYLNRHVSNVAKETLGLRGHKTRPQNVRSLDEPIPGAEGDSIALGDTVPDPQAEEELERVERDIWNDQLHNALEGCLSALTDDQSDVIRARFYNGYTSKVMAEVTNIRHDKLKSAISRHKSALETFGLLTRYGGESSGGRPEVIYKLNEQQSTLLITFLKNTPVIVAFKTELVRQFYAMRAELQTRHVRREELKPVRKSLTDVIQEQCAGDRWAYMRYTNLAYKSVMGKNAVQIRKERDAPSKANAVEYLTADELADVTRAEGQIAVLLDIGMDYLQVKALIMNRLAAKSA